jgi:hypothetical protein
MRDDRKLSPAKRDLTLEGLAAASLSLPLTNLPPLASALGRLDQEHLWDLLERWPQAVETAFKMLDLALVGPEVMSQLALSDEAADLTLRTAEFLDETADVTREAAGSRLLAHAELRLGLERGTFLGAPLDNFVVAQMLDPHWPGLEVAVAATLAEQLRITGYPTLASLLDAPSHSAFRLLVRVLSEQLWSVASLSELAPAVLDGEALWMELAQRDSILDTYLRTANRPRSGRVRRARSAASFAPRGPRQQPIEVEVLDDDDHPVARFNANMDASEVVWSDLDPTVDRTTLLPAPPRTPTIEPTAKSERLRALLHSLFIACVVIATALFLVAMAVLIR